MISGAAKVVKMLDGQDVSTYACFDAEDPSRVEPQVEQMLASIRFTD